MRSIFRFACAFYALSLANLCAQESETRNVVVTGENEAEHDQFTELGEYAQPAWAERSRMSSTTSVYVLSPQEMFAGNVWEGDFDRHGKTTHDFIQEIDFGLPHRFELGIENEFGVIENRAHETSATFEVRYALAKWNAIPLNPTISLEYILGFGTSARTSSRQSDALAGRLLLGQNFGDHFGYGLNLSLQQAVSRRDEREFEIRQTIAYGTMKGKLELGPRPATRTRASVGAIKSRTNLSSDQVSVGNRRGNFASAPPSSSEAPKTLRAWRLSF